MWRFLRIDLPPKPKARHEIAERSYPLNVAARDGLVVLTYVARCDGAFATNELAEDRNYLIDLAEAEGFQRGEPVLEEVLRYAANLFPAPRALFGAIKHLESANPDSITTSCEV